MDTHSNLEYLCRVCAANTKGKNTVAECVYILKTAGLKDKLDKFLYLKVSKNYICSRMCTYSRKSNAQKTGMYIHTYVGVQLFSSPMYKHPEGQVRNQTFILQNITDSSPSSTIHRYSIKRNINVQNFVAGIYYLDGELRHTLKVLKRYRHLQLLLRISF